MTFKSKIVRIKELFIDLKYGGYLGGKKKTPFAALGANDTASTEYGALSEIFSTPPIAALPQNGVIMDVGCGKGRVLRFLVDRFPQSKLIGIEIDDDVARLTRQRLKKFENISIISGDVRNMELIDRSLVYIFNSFKEHVMNEFIDLILTSDTIRQISIIYYNPVHLSAFKRDDRFKVLEIKISKIYPRCALISFNI